MSVRFERRGDVAIVTLDTGPDGAIGQAQRAGLSAALDRIAAAPALVRIVLALGEVADGAEDDAPDVPPHLPDIVDAIEASPVPWIAAISGAALGGGCELALACRARVATPSARLGLPEVALGVVPGATGTQRLPRLIGLAPALEMIATGRLVAAARALELGLIDAIADDPLARATEITLPDRAATAALSPPAPDPAAIEAARTVAARKFPGQVAPIRAIDLIAASCTTPFAEAAAAERAAFLELRRSDQARALRHLFSAERAARAPALLKSVEVADFGHIAVVGGGTMGAGIAYACLNAGLTVTLLERDTEAAARAQANVEGIVTDGLRRGLIDEPGAADRRARIAFATDFAAAAHADLAIEAAFEAIDVKRAVFADLEAALRPGAPLATNTSYLDINEIARDLDAPERVLGQHFFAPAHVMKLIEVVAADATSEATLASGLALAKRLRKVPVLARVCDGFIGNRILARARAVADDLLLRGATPWEIDAAMEAFGYPMGPYAVQDLSGLEIGYANRRRLDATRDPDAPYVAVADRLAEAGRLGRKTSAGWYDYDGTARRAAPAVTAIIEAERTAAGRTATRVEPGTITRRLLLAMIDEAANILAEGIARTAADIDLVTVFGYGFPRWRGGLMHYADSLGPRAILRDLRALQAENPALWPSSPMIEAVVAIGTGFADFRAP